MNTSFDSQANSGAATQPQNAAAVHAVQTAIAAANPLVNGVNFGPFSAMVVPTRTGVFGNFTNIYDGGGDTSISFYRFTGDSSGGWLPLGDLVVVPAGKLPRGVMFFAPGSDPAAFAHPTGFNRLLDDSGSGDDRDVVYWGPIAPAGYVAVGICFSNGNAPTPSNYWCIKQSYALEVSSATAWNDQGANWDADGNLNRPCFNGVSPEIAPPGGILILPPTLLSAQAGNTPYALVGTQATLNVAPIGRPAPVYVDGVTAPGSTTAYGLGNVVVVPFTAVAGDTIPNQALQSPFYYVASEPSWLCTQVLPTQAGGMMTLTETIGVTETASTGFQQTTSMMVSAEFGAAYGGVSASVSASLTEELQLQVSQGITGSTQNTVSVEINLPQQPVTSVWEGQNAVQVFRADGTTVATVTYSTTDLRFAPSGNTSAPTALQAALARG